MKTLKQSYEETLKKPLLDYILYEKKRTFPLRLLFAGGLIVFLWVSFYLDLLVDIDIAYEWLHVLGLSSVLITLFTLITLKFRKKESILVTKDALLLKRNRKVSILLYEELVAVTKPEHDALVIETKSLKKRIQLKGYPKNIETLDKLFKARGFLQGDAFNHEIHFTNDRIDVETVVEELDESTEYILERFKAKYRYLNIDYLDELSFYNVQVNRMQLTDKKHITLFTTHLDVKQNHPENTKFKAQKTDEAMITFTHMTDLEIKPSNQAAKAVKQTIPALRNILKNAVIFDTNIQKKSGYYIFIMTIEQAVSEYHVTFKFEEVVTGWNALEEDAWFVNK